MISRRDFIRISGMATAAALINWQCPTRKVQAQDGVYDAIIIGAGLGGLTTAALLAKNGFRPLVIERRPDKVGGYATSFQRNVDGIGSFTCEASLHGLTGNPLDIALLSELFGIPAEKIKEDMLVPHKYSWSSLYPDSALDIPQPWAVNELVEDVCAKCKIRDKCMLSGLPGIKNVCTILVDMFPNEADGLTQYMQCWGGLLSDVAKFYSPGGGIPDDMSEFPVIYPTWTSMLWEEKRKKTKTETKTLTDLFKEKNIRDPRLQAILGQSWPYYGLPPAEIPAWLYLMGTGFYHAYGNYYIKGSSQSLSNALYQTIVGYGGEVLLNTGVTEILLDENGRAVGVKTTNLEYPECVAGAVVSNAAVPQTFGLIPESAVPTEYLDMISSYKPSTSHFNVWLKVALDDDRNDDFLGSYEKLGSNTLVYADYKHEHSYSASVQCNPEKSGFMVVAYDKVGTDSPSGYASITLTMLSGYRPWKRFEADYLAGKKAAYHAEKTRIAEALIRLADERVLPGLSDRATILDASTPLTNVRFTSNNQGAIYGYDQTEDNSGISRLGNRTPIPGLYLAGAWTNPGGSFEMVMLSGTEAVKYMTEDFKEQGLI